MNFIARDRTKGRGVYAGKHYAPGDLVEVCELILIQVHELGEGLEGYVYEYDDQRVAVALGNGSLYNHSDQWNTDYSFNRSKRQLKLYANRDINRGEELTIDYGYSEADRRRFGLR